MSVTLLSRQRGAVLACGRADCPWRISTGQGSAWAIRSYGATLGWIRRTLSGSMNDLCPDHAESFDRTAKERRAEYARRRALTPEQRRDEDNKRRRDKRAAARAEGG